MTVDPDIPRRVAQARHDIEDLYEQHVKTHKSVVRLEKAVVRLEGSVVRLEETQQAQGASLVRLEETQQAQGELLSEVLDILRAGRG